VLLVGTGRMESEEPDESEEGARDVVLAPGFGDVPVWLDRRRWGDAAVPVVVVVDGAIFSLSPLGTEQWLGDTEGEAKKYEEEQAELNLEPAFQSRREAPSVTSQ
jgi:hypothetical protein